jgi:hypothetical protein
VVAQAAPAKTEAPKVVPAEPKVVVTNKNFLIFKLNLK